jgi:DNA-binding transcriptional MerR regulator
MKRRGNRRYYQHHEVLMIRRIRELLYDQGFTISGARNKLQELVQADRDRRTIEDHGAETVVGEASNEGGGGSSLPETSSLPHTDGIDEASWAAVKKELTEIRSLLGEHF